MPKLDKFIDDEYNKFATIKSSGDKKRLQMYEEETKAIIQDVTKKLNEIIKANSDEIKNMQALLFECIKDTAIVEGIHHSKGDFTNIEEHIYVSMRVTFSVYQIMFDAKMEFDFDKIIAYITSPNVGNDDDTEQLLRWFRMLVQYFSQDLDNEDEQLSKGSSKRKNNNK